MNFTNCSKRYISSVDDNGKLYKNIANFGLKPFENAKVSRNGEYHGFEIQAIDYILPLFTSENIKKIYELLLKNEIQTIIEKAKITNEFKKYGISIVHYIIDKWCKNVHVECPKNINHNVDENDNELKELNSRIDRDISCPIVGKFKIISIGKNDKTGGSVVPDEWIDKEFLNGNDLHHQMNKLEQRKGKPPVTYCCIYGMSIATNEFNQWEIFSNIKMINNYENVLIISKSDNKIKTKLKQIKSFTDELIKLIGSSSNYKLLYTTKSKLNLVLLIENGIFCTLDKTSNKKNKENTSYLSSLLQKCFRNQYATGTLSDTIVKLHYSAGYNLPDQHFARVSGPKQLFWRSYISIIEDVSGYYTYKYLDLMDLYALSLVCSIDSNVSLNDKLLNYVQESLVCAQQIESHWNWGQYTAQNKIPVLKHNDNYISRMQNSIVLALTLSPMMRNDFAMLLKCHDLLDKINQKVNDLPNANETVNLSILNFDQELNLETKMRALDMHCFPYLLIQLQGALPFIPTEKETLQNLSHFIWNFSSGFNTRTHSHCEKIKYGNKKIDIFNTLMDIQYITIAKPSYAKAYDWIPTIWNPKFIINKTKINNNDSRTAFLLIFGKKYKVNKKIKGKQYDIILSGTKECPYKVKKSIDKNKTIYIENGEKDIVWNEFVKQFNEENNLIDFSKISAPYGYKWNFTGKEKLGIVQKDNMYEFNVGKTKLLPFDGSIIVSPINVYQTIELPGEILEYLNIMFYNEYGETFEILLELFAIGKIRFDASDFRIFEWGKFAKDIPKEILLYVTSRILMSQCNELQVGPVDRTGNKTHNSISYLYEGVIWRLIVTMYMLYPNVFTPSSPYKFTINKNTYGYCHMLNTFTELTKINNIVNSVNVSVPKITSKLWDHQKTSVDKIVHGMTCENKKGFGDASDVGSGKTLTALAVASKLMEYYYKLTSELTSSGILIMLPTEKLYDTWKTEIEKHTKGFTVIEQLASGKLFCSKLTKKSESQLSETSIVLTTMGRCREHPIIHKWLLVVIDECLTVQNKEALQTEEAWRQTSYSHFGVLMLSATFFRSRFDKMLYMINMLNTQLPPTVDYLDCILCETIVCNLNNTDRKWITGVHNIGLEKTIMKKYNQMSLKYKEVGFEKVYHMLSKFIRDEVDYIEIFKNSINNIIKNRPNSKILIYANSKKEADKIAQIDKTIGRYPEKKLHTVVSYAEATYGLNDLIVFNTILTRPPDADKLPQIKGRLDRPNQKENTLYIEYILLKDTIEEANLYKLEIANNFYGSYIMPLAEFYELAILLKK